MYEYTYGEAPVSIVEPPINIEADEEENNGRSNANVDTNVDILNKFSQHL